MNYIDIENYTFSKMEQLQALITVSRILIFVQASAQVLPFYYAAIFNAVIFLSMHLLFRMKYILDLIFMDLSEL